MNIDLTDPRVWIAVAIGAVSTYPVLFLYERVLKAMAWLQDREELVGSMASRSIMVARYVFGIAWMILFIAIFIVSPSRWFAVRHLVGPATAYLLSLCGVIFLRYWRFNQRMRSLGIAPEQRVALRRQRSADPTDRRT